MHRKSNKSTVRRFAKYILGALVALAAIAVWVVSQGGAGAVPSPTIPPNGYHACVDPTTFQLKDGAGRPAVWPNDPTHPQVCFGGRVLVEFPSLDQVTSLEQRVTTLESAKPIVYSMGAQNVNLAHIGGSWGAGHTVVGNTQSLTQGVYVVSITGDFYRAGAPGSCETASTPVLQIQLNSATTHVTAYTGAFPANAAETCGVGSDGSPNGLEQTASATKTIVVPAGGATFELDAFGYNPDRGSEGSGNFAVNGLATLAKVG